MAMTFTRDLDPLSSSGLELADPSTDLTGRPVLDRDGAQVGTVSDMLIEPQRRVARMLVLEHAGGLLGLGKKHHLVPLEAVTVTDGEVRIDRSKDDILAGGEYTAPEGEEEELHYAAVYAEYGIQPYWETEDTTNTV
jgi:sporulation protein YlmC with PRC-barrel domain